MNELQLLISTIGLGIIVGTHFFIEQERESSLFCRIFENIIPALAITIIAINSALNMIVEEGNPVFPVNSFRHIWISAIICIILFESFIKQIFVDRKAFLEQSSRLQNFSSAPAPLPSSGSEPREDSSTPLEDIRSINSSHSTGEGGQRVNGKGKILKISPLDRVAFPLFPQVPLFAV